MNIIKLLKRIERILLPYIIFPIFVMILNNYIHSKLKPRYINLKISFRDLIIQLIFGSGFLLPLWYLYDLLLFTFIFLIIITIFSGKYLLVLNTLTVLCYIFQCSGYNTQFFAKLKYGCYRHALKKIAIMFPFAVLGFTIYSFKLIEEMKKNRFITIYFSSVILYVINKYPFFNNIADHINSSLLYFFGSSLLFFIFILLPTQSIKKNKVIAKIIEKCTSNTMGVYLLHTPIFRYLVNQITTIKFESKRKVNFYNCLKIYFICYYISFVCSKIFKNTKIRNFFK